MRDVGIIGGVGSDVGGESVYGLPTCNLDSFSVAVLLEGVVSPSDEAGEEATGLHHDSTQHNLAGGVWQHRIALITISE